jgi:N-acetylglucosaminyl-diphospho-decaprenol L-rhamnosyltransferase
MTAGVDEQPSRKTQVAVAIVSWNTRELLRACLGSLAGDASTGLAEVWVVDNASTDGSAELVEREFPWARLIASTENLGFGRAVNEVAAQTQSAWIAPANADTRVSPGALETMLAEGERHPEAAVVAPRLVLPDGSAQHSAYPFPTVPFTLAYLAGLTRLNRRIAHRWCIGDGFDPDENRAVPWVVGAFLLVRRQAWDQVGGFDQEQWMYAEDLDLGWRLGRAGWKARYVPSAEVLHDESAATSQAWGAERHARWHASTYRWLMKRRGLAYARLIATLNVAGFLARAALLSVSGSVRGRTSDEARQSALNAARAHSVGLRSRRLLESVR